MATDQRDKTVVTVIAKPVERAVATKDSCLVVIYGPDLGKKYNIDPPSMIVGRSNKCAIQVDQESVSRNHAKFSNTGRGVLLRDLGSTNGTFVNDEQITECQLKDGDMVKIGRTIFKFLSGGNVENAYHEEIYRLTTIDGLTQVYNKRYFREALERELGRSHRYGRSLSMIMFDIDHFKLINDTHGHLAGDHILRQLCAVIKERIRREDLMARYGGEEFAIVLPEIDEFNARQFADKIRKLVERTSFMLDQTRIPVTISIGVATTTTELKDPDEFVKQADERLYEAKRTGRNRVC